MKRSLTLLVAFFLFPITVEAQATIPAVRSVAAIDGNSKPAQTKTGSKRKIKLSITFDDSVDPQERSRQVFRLTTKIDSLDFGQSAAASSCSKSECQGKAVKVRDFLKSVADIDFNCTSKCEWIYEFPLRFYKVCKVDCTHGGSRILTIFKRPS